MAPQLTAPTAKAYRELSDDLGDLVHGWTTLKELTLNGNVNAIVRRSADRFAALMQASLFAYCVALVGRMLDDTTAGRRKTCCFRTLFADAAADGIDVTPIQRRLRDVNRLSRKIVRARNERIAHNSYAAFVEGTGHQLFTFAEFDSVLAAMRALVNDFERTAGLHPMDYAASDGVADLTTLASLLARSQAG